MRRHCTFACAGADLVGTLDDAPGTTGLLIVSGGNEIRAGAWNGQALLAARLAARGVPVFRFDRRGIGDSEGENLGFRGSSDDIIAAVAAFRAEAPQLRQIVAFGNCDAASALMLGGGFGCDALVLSNPWTIEQGAGEQADAPPPPAALRAHYARRLTDPAALLRLLKGRISLRAVAASLRNLLRKTEPTALAGEIAAGLAPFGGPVMILLAGRDRTVQGFLAIWNRDDPRLRRCAGASHSYVEPFAQQWLEDQLVKVLTSALN